MSRGSGWNAEIWVGLILIVLGVIGSVIIVSVDFSLREPEMSGVPDNNSGQLSDVSLGEQIYTIGVDENGRRISRTRVGLMMRSTVSCAACHGDDARGTAIRVMMNVVDVPDIRWSTLTSEEEAEEEGGLPFDEASFYRALTEGIDPSGEALETLMPRWGLTRDESDAIIEYLKTR